MFFLIGLLIMGSSALLFVRAIVGLITGIIQNNKLAGWGWGLTVFLMVSLFFRVAYNGNDDPEADPREVFQAVFGQEPAPAIRNLRAYHENDEMAEIYLQFTAPPRLVSSLVQHKFTLNNGVLPRGWDAAPAWFSTQILSKTRIYTLDKTEPGEYIFLYDPPRQQARLFFKNSISILLKTRSTFPKIGKTSL